VFGSKIWLLKRRKEGALIIILCPINVYKYYILTKSKKKYDSIEEIQMANK
jgi:hypothetical protein